MVPEYLDVQHIGVPHGPDTDACGAGPREPMFRKWSRKLQLGKTLDHRYELRLRDAECGRTSLKKLDRAAILQPL